jgi:N-acetylmuramoyl-L-alanine amidase
MKVSENHLLEGAKWEPIVGGSDMVLRRALVIHYTEGASAKSSIEHNRDVGLAAHLYIDRDGTIYQARPFSRKGAHAGISVWYDPNTELRYEGLNSCSIGIELANAGKNAGVIEWAKKHAGASVVKLKHRNGGAALEWEDYPTEQLTACFTAAKAIVLRYNLDDVTGHDCISPDRKEDPGPAFPMKELREFCGFDGLPDVHWQ